MPDGPSPVTFVDFTTGEVLRPVNDRPNAELDPGARRRLEDARRVAHLMIQRDLHARQAHEQITIKSVPTRKPV